MKARDLIFAYERAGPAIGTSQLPSKASPNPQQSANVVVSVRNDRNLRESPLNTEGLSFHGKVTGLPAGQKKTGFNTRKGFVCSFSSLGRERGYYVPARKYVGVEKGCGCWYGSGGGWDGGGSYCC